MKTTNMMIIALVVVLFGAYRAGSMERKMEEPMDEKSQKTETAVFAGGCFWCTESDFQKIDGVIEAVSGYTGGREANPTYRQVSAGGTGHVEAVKVVYDPSMVTYATLLDVFWRHVDPTDAGGQFVDRGSQYRSVIFYAGDRERRLAEESKKNLEATGRFGKPVATEILPLGPFYPAEDYHQDYYKKNPVRYHWYRSGSGRDQFLKKAWADMKDDMKPDMNPVMTDEMKPGKEDGMKPGMEDGMENKEMNPGTMKEKTGGGMYAVPDETELRRRLTPMQYKVARQNGTEPPFNNQYWDNHAAGIYVDIVSGEPLFSSLDKFESGTGWPSFTRPLAPENVVEKTDRSFFMTRTEVRSRHGDSHLGHLFTDGPEPTGLRYCINSAALRFVPESDLEKEGYGGYRKLFR